MNPYIRVLPVNRLGAAYLAIEREGLLPVGGVASVSSTIGVLSPIAGIGTRLATSHVLSSKAKPYTAS